MPSNYVSEKMREMDFYLSHTRTLPRSAVHDDALYDTIKAIEIMYRQGSISRQKAALYGIYIKLVFGIDYTIVSDRHIVFIPRSNAEVERAMFSYPQLIGIFGNRNAGKTVTAWSIALKFLERFKNGTVYVFGDVDGLGKSFEIEAPEIAERIIVRNDYGLPQVTSKPKLALYNELSEELLNKRAMGGDNVKLNLQALRNRHRKTWVIYNVIRFSSLESLLRDTVDISLYKWTTASLLKNIINNVPKAYGEIIKIVTTLNRNESLAVVPMSGRGTYFGIYETNPPEILLRAHKNASKNEKLMFAKDEKDLYIMEKIAEFKEKGLSGDEISLILRKEGINLTGRSVNIRYNKWKKISEM